MANIVNTLTLIEETARVGKVQPTIVLTFIGVNWRTTSAFVPGYVHRCGFSLRNNEGVVHDDILGGAEIPGPMDTAIHLLKSLPWSKCFLFLTTAILHRQAAAFYHVESIARVIMPREYFARLYGKRSHRDCGRTVEEF